jgi:hypothetical protein
VTALRAAGAWTSPVLLAWLAALVFQGDASAPVIVLVALLAPLVALLRTPASVPINPAHGAIAAVGVGIVLWADFALIGDLAQIAGIHRWYALAVALIVVLLPLLSRELDALWPATIPVGLGACAVALVAIAGLTGATPWGAWNAVASRPIFTFDDRSAAVTDGRPVAKDTTLVFTEPHRVTAVAPGTYRVLERDGARLVARDWRLAIGDVLMLRPGDGLVVARGLRVRFEAGKRVPGVAPSGPVWADGTSMRRIPLALAVTGAAITMVGGASVLVGGAVPATMVGALAAPAALVLFVFAPVAFGVYTMYAAPELSVGAVLLTPLAHLPSAIGARHAAALGTLVGMGLVALFVGTAASLGRRFEMLSGLDGDRARAAWAVICGIAAAAAVFSTADASRLLLIGLGVLATVWLAPALAIPAGRTTVIGTTAMLAGSAVGLVSFASFALAGGWFPGDSAMLGQYPALGAAPLGWIAARLVARWQPAVDAVAVR